MRVCGHYCDWRGVACANGVVKGGKGSGMLVGVVVLLVVVVAKGGRVRDGGKSRGGGGSVISMPVYIACFMVPY